MSKNEHLNEAIALANLIGHQKEEHKPYFARLILRNLKEYLKPEK